MLKLLRCLYGLKQAPRNWFHFPKGKLEECHLVQSESDPCLFFGKEIICICYVDDCCFYSTKKEYIDRLLDDLKKCGLDLNVENDMARYLGVHIDKRDDRKLE